VPTMKATRLATLVPTAALRSFTERAIKNVSLTSIGVCNGCLKMEAYHTMVGALL
jgi:hypothetical protein